MADTRVGFVALSKTIKVLPMHQIENLGEDVATAVHSPRSFRLSFQNSNASHRQSASAIAMMRLFISRLAFRASLKKNFRFAGAARAVALRCKLGQYGKYSRFACALPASPRRSHRITEILFEKRSKPDTRDSKQIPGGKLPPGTLANLVLPQMTYLAGA